MEYPSQSTNLPVELIERIIDDIHDDFAALTSISQTCHTLLQLCRKRLFRSINLYFITAPLPPDRFRWLLRCNPDIGHYVRELVLFIDESLERWVPGEPNADTENIQTLTQMPFLEKLDIWGGCYDSAYVTTTFHLLHPTLQQPILDCIYSPSLTELSIHDLDIPVRIFRSCVKLSALTVTAVGEAEMPEPVEKAGLSSQPIVIPRLRSFTSNGWFHSLALGLVRYRGSDGHPAIKFDGLKTLTTHCIDEEDMQATMDICKEAAELEIFTCLVRGPHLGFRGLGSCINISAFSTLKTFGVACVVGLDEDLFQGLCEELEMFPCTNVLEILDIEIKVFGAKDHSNSTRDEWGRLDAVLSRGFSRLHRVSVSVNFWFSSERPFESSELHKESEQIPRTQFPRLWKNTAVKLDISMSIHEPEAA